MGREVKRVPADFGWPLNKTWKGYVRPDSLAGERCESCNGSGQTHFGWWLQGFSYMMGMLADDVRDQEQGKPLHPWLQGFPRHHGHWEYPVKDDPQSGAGWFVIDRPGPDAIEFFAKLMNVSPADIGGSLFSKADTHYAVMLKLLEVTGVDVACPDCEGEGSTEKYPGQRAEAEAWTRTEPPEGDGWQLWETVSEGSPVSPVFAYADELAGWMSDPARGEDRVPVDVAANFIRQGWAPTFIGDENGLLSGVEAVGMRGGEEQGQ